MTQFHLKFNVPDSFPFDRHDWGIQVQGEIVAPFVTSHQPTRFWFSHYGGVGNGKHLLVRYELDHMADTGGLPIQPTEHTEFDIHADLGGDRFRDPSQGNSSPDERGSKIFDFLNAAANLTLDQLLGKRDGYWLREKSPDVGNNHFGSPLESVHHLFCNLSGVETSIAVVEGKEVYSTLHAKILGLYGPDTWVIRVQF